LIFYLTTKDFTNPMRSFLYTWGKNLSKRITILTYQQAFRKRRFPAGTYIFSDIERLTPIESEKAAQIHQVLHSRWGSRILMLNHPTRSMRRFELLRTLNRVGINIHNAYRLIEGGLPEKYPVFLRGADDHKGASSGLIDSRDKLEREIEAFIRSGKSREDKIIVEFNDTADETGLYRKYSAFFIDGTIIPRHICFSWDWQVKLPDVSSREAIREEVRFIHSNSHAEQLAKIFDAARIHYGRIDYGLRDGRIQVWEINTNPRLASFVSSENPERHDAQVLFTRLLRQAFERIDRRSEAIDGFVENPLFKLMVKQSIVRGAKTIGERIIYSLPLADHHKVAMRSVFVGMKSRFLSR